MRSICLSLAISFSLIGLIPAGASAQGGLATRVAELEAKVATLAELEAKVATLEVALVEVQAILEFVRVESEPINGLAGPHWIVEGANVHVRSGSGATNDGCGFSELDYPNCESLTGLGNLIVGYNEGRRGFPDRSGSHNLVVGRSHIYGSFGGLVAGRLNTILGAFASVSGGDRNMAIGDYSSVSGGLRNRATADGSSVSGGLNNDASGPGASVSGGLESDASGSFSSVSGGAFNKASGIDSSVSGGLFNQASGLRSSVSGGTGNEASGFFSSVSGGRNNVAGALASSVSGGENRTAPDDFNWAAGNLFEPN